MEVIVAKNAGFCFGVRRAVDGVCEEAAKGRVSTYGPITHNKQVMAGLRQQGVEVVDSLKHVTDEKIAIRAHGVPPEVYSELEEKGIDFVDFTCPFVKKIHKVVEKSSAEGKRVIILGNPKHPEIIGINGWAGGKAIILQSVEDIDAADFREGEYVLVVQTTFSVHLFEKLVPLLKEKIPDLEIKNTICSATIMNQRNAEQLSKQVDRMFVLGDKSSSNTQKLYDICKKNLQETYLVESIDEIMLNKFSYSDKIGLTAGASTPPAIIKEAFKVMSEFKTNNTTDAGQPVGDTPFENTEKVDQTFEEMLSESFVTLHTGDIVKGTVMQVSNGEVVVNLGYKSDGIIQKNQFSDDPNVDPAEVVKLGEAIEVYVLRVNDGEGNVLLSKKRLDAQKNIIEVEEAFNSKTPLKGKITEAIKGGVIANICGLRAFVPSSQVSDRYVEDLEALKGKEYDFTILEFDKSKRRIVAGRRELALAEAEALRDKVFSEIEPGMKVKGTVSRITDFGAFVDLGGVDGLIHISELSWGRVRKVSDVLKSGDEVNVNVLDVNKEKGKISLSLKDVDNDPWNTVEDKYPVGSIVTGKVVRMVSFGAFVELEDGVDGLVHISQIADKHVVKPEDELSIGQEIHVKVTDLNVESRRVSLSKKAADGADEYYDELPASEAPVEEDVVAEPPVAEVSADENFTDDGIPETEEAPEVQEEPTEAEAE